MKFIYLFCVLLFILNNVKADENYEYDDELDYGIYPREYYKVSKSITKKPILPPRPTLSYGYPDYQSYPELSTIPSLKDKLKQKFGDSKKKLDETKKKMEDKKKKIEKDIKDKMESLKSQKLKNKPIYETSTIKPLILYNRKPEKIVKIKKPKKPKISKKCILIYKALFG